MFDVGGVTDELFDPQKRRQRVFQTEAAAAATADQRLGWGLRTCPSDHVLFSSDCWIPYRLREPEYHLQEAPVPTMDHADFLQLKPTMG